jgi:hypothetical protein
MNKLSEDILAIDLLKEKQKQFLFKRLFFSQVNAIAAWGVVCSAITAWSLLYWLKPTLVSSSLILQLLEDKKIDSLQLAELAVTGASAITLIFILLAFIGLMMLSFSKKEKQYLQIIQSMKDINKGIKE